MAQIPVEFAELTAALAGIIGVSVAVYLQLVSSTKTPPRYVLGFFVAGCTMLLLHPAVWAQAPIARYTNLIQLGGAVLAVVGETVLAVYVARRYHVDSPLTVLHNLFEDSKPDKPA